MRETWGSLNLKTIAWLLVLLGFTIPMVAGNSTNTNGAVCNSACVAQVNGVATCDPGCTDRSGDCIFISDEGDLTRLANPAECKGHMHKPAKALVVPKQTEAQREKQLRVQELYNNAP